MKFYDKTSDIIVQFSQSHQPVKRLHMFLHQIPCTILNIVIQFTYRQKRGQFKFDFTWKLFKPSPFSSAPQRL